MPAGLVTSVPTTAVMPRSLSRAFVEAQTWPARVVEYHDGSSQRSAMLSKPRRSWQLAKHIPADLLAELRAFWVTVGADAFYFYNPKETVPPFSYDPTGVATAGRYRVRFASAWSESSTVGPLQDTSIELVEVFAGQLRAPVVPLDARVLSTGVGDDKLPMPPGTLERHWRFVSGPAGTPPTAYCRGNYNISALPAAPVPLGDFIFELTFDMSDLDIGSAAIEGEVTGTDDATTLYFNDAQLGTAFYNTLPFRLTAGFNAGLNTLRLKNNNSMPIDEMCALQIYSATADPL